MDEIIQKMTDAFIALVGRPPTDLERWDAQGPTKGTEYVDSLPDFRADYTLEDGRSVIVFFRGGPDNEAKAFSN